MTGSDPTLPPENPPSALSPAPRPLWQRAVAVLTAPRSVFEGLVDRPAWFWTAMVTSVFALVVGFLIYDPVIYPSMLEQAQGQNLSSEALAQAESMYASPAMKFTISSMGALFNFVLIVVVGLLLFAICGFLLGGRVKVKQALAVAAHAMLVHIPKSVIAIPVMLARGDPSISLGPGALFPPSEAEGFAAKALANFLGSLDLFNLWSLALCVLGMAVVSRLSTRQVGTLVVLGYFALAALMSLAGAAMQPR